MINLATLMYDLRFKNFIVIPHIFTHGGETKLCTQVTDRHRAGKTYNMSSYLCC